MNRFFLSRTILFVAYFVTCLCTATPDVRAASNKYFSNPASPYALTISGGISLGVYEAGLNWILVETMRDYYQREKLLKLEVVTGASAGAINTLASAFRFCESEDENEYGKVEKNLFREIWIDVDISDQMPADLRGYDQLELAWGSHGTKKLKDSLFSRKNLKQVIGLFREQAEKPIYRINCEIKLALIVTRSQALEQSFATSTVPQSIKTQRFVIPLKVTGDSSSTKDKTRLIFKNNMEYGEMQRSGSAYLYLPQTPGGEILFDNVIRAALASSAFPLAFGRVEQQYCVPGAFPPSHHCPAGTGLSEGYFIDGGLFDNVPIGVAVALLEEGKNEEEKGKGNYIYMDPANRRVPLLQKEDRKPLRDTVDSGSLALSDQIKSMTPVLGTFTNQELYRSLSEQFSIVDGDTRNRQRFLLLTKRFPLLSGNFANHFGAFFDPAFRHYDYAAGVYDGLRNVVDYFCSERLLDAADVRHFCPKGNIALFKALLKKYLPADSESDEVRKIKYLIRLFLEWEEGLQDAHAWYESETAELASVKNGAEVIVFQTLQQQGGDENFKVFLKALKPNESAFRPRLQSMIANPSAWKMALLRHGIQRLLDLERNEGGEALRLLKFTSIMLHSKKIKRNGKGYRAWAPSSVPDKEKNIGYRLTPDSIALDGMQTGVAVSWLGVPNALVFKHSYVEVDLSYHHQFKEVSDERTYYLSAGPSLRYATESTVFSSIGLGVNGNANLEPSTKFGNEVLGGWELSLGFLADKIRLTWGNRDFSRNYIGEDWTLRVGVSDIDAFIYLFVD